MRDSVLETLILYGGLGSAILSFHDPRASLLLKGCGSRGSGHCTESGRHHSLSSPNKLTQRLQPDNATSALLSTPRCGVGAASPLCFFCPSSVSGCCVQILVLSPPFWVPPGPQSTRPHRRPPTHSHAHSPALTLWPGGGVRYAVQEPVDKIVLDCVQHD